MAWLRMAGVIGVIAAAVFVHAAEPEVRVELAAPENWSGETIQLPPGFAPTMVFKGVEEVRFAPGMFKSDRADFFSYAMVFGLPNQMPPDLKALEVELLKYYRGLAVTVGKSRKREIDPATFSLKLVPKPETSDQWVGTLQWIEPFVTGKTQSLRFELKSGRVPDSQVAYLLMAASPQPVDHAIWVDLRKILKSVKWHVVEKTGS